MNRIQPRTVGFTFAVILGAWHAMWATLVWGGVAQRLLDFVFRLHMITPPYQVTPFNPTTAGELVAFTAAIGYVSGWFLGLVWNQFAAWSTPTWQVEHHEPRHAH